jgi:hypothetical protein
MRTRKRLRPQVEGLEPKSLLSSSALPVLTLHDYHKVLTSINHYTLGFSLDFSKSNLVSNLTLVSKLVPFGKLELLPLWQKDVDAFNAKIKGSGCKMVVGIKNDFLEFVKQGVASGKFVLE